MSATPRLLTSVWMYPWDVLDEGPLEALRLARDLAQVDAVNVAVTYHAGLFLLPHNPRRRLYAAEDGVAYFRADARWFGDGPLPTLSKLANSVDPLAETLAAGQAMDLGVRAWMVCCHNSRLAQAEPNLAVQNALGDRLPFALCPMQPRVQQFLTGLVDALSAYRDLDAIELEALYWQPAEHGWHHAKFGIPLDPLASLLLGLCCCRACADAAGVDQRRLMEPIRERLLDALRGKSVGAAARDDVARISAELTALLDARTDGLTRLLAHLVERARVPVRALVGSGLVQQPWSRGIDLAAWARVAPRVTVNAYHSEAAEVHRTLSGFRAAAPRADLVVGLNATHPTTSDEVSLQAQSSAALEHRPVELSFYHYGLLGLDRLGWVGRAAASARSAVDETVLRD